MSKRAEVIGNPFEKYDCKRKYKSKKKIVSYIGNSNLQKRARFFIDIAKDLNKKDSNISFHVLGDVPYESKEILCLKKYNIKFFKKNYDVRKFLNESNLLVAPGINEGFGRTLVEAMLLKVPVVASNSGAHKEIILNDKYGILAKPDNLHDFSLKILKSLKNYDKKKIDLAFIYCKENFNIDVYLNKLKYLYDNLLK
ncbi:glycosyltransferase [Rickettsiales bacterium]|nr:glycosyltransferase [Rickettsiales bacterium]